MQPAVTATRDHPGSVVLSTSPTSLEADSVPDARTMTTVPVVASSLRVDFLSETHVLWPGEELTMGRAGILHIDDNPSLPRLVGRFSCHQGHWWLYNSGASISLLVSDRTSPSQIVVTPGRAVPLPFADALVSFQAGKTVYEVETAITTLADLEHDGNGSEPTLVLDLGKLAFTVDQVLLILALSERRLRPTPFDQSDLPSNAEVADRLGWRMAQFNRKLDHICAKLSARGVPGLKRVDGKLANERRRKLVEFAVASKLVTVEMLSQLPPRRI
jgi:hypothetical protein